MHVQVIDGDHARHDIASDVLSARVIVRKDAAFIRIKLEREYMITNVIE